MQTGWAQRPTLPVAPDIAADRAQLAAEVARRAKVWAEAEKVSKRCCDNRGNLEPGSSRAAITSANAKWMRAAEDRDAKERNFIAALECAGFAKSEA